MIEIGAREIVYALGAALVALIGYLAQRQVVRIDKLEKHTAEVATVKQVHDIVDRAITSPLEEIRTDMREQRKATDDLRTLVIKMMNRNID